jgi:Zn-finger nucleic acid-binding protein
MLNCPKCTAEMFPDKFGQIIIDRCAGCGGIWFDIGELNLLKEMKGSEAIDEGLAKVGRIYDKVARTVNCPRCATPLARMSDKEQPHIHMEACKSCSGVFLDAGEFKDVKFHTLADYVKDFFARK